MTKSSKKAKHTPRVESVAADFTVKLSTRLQYLPINASLVVYRLEIGSRDVSDLPPSVQGLVENRATEGFATTDSIKSYLTNKTDHIAQAEDVELAHPKLRAAIEKFGLNSGYDYLEKMEVAPLSETPFTEIALNGARTENIFRFDWDRGNVFGLDGMPLAAAQFFDYIMAGIRNDAYDLAAAEKILRANPRVTFFDEDGETLGAKKSAIRAIPYYNSNPYSDKCIEFRFQPTQGEVHQLWNSLSKKKQERFEMMPAILEADLLGLKAAKLPRKKKRKESPEK